MSSLSLDGYKYTIFLHATGVGHVILQGSDQVAKNIGWGDHCWYIDIIELVRLLRLLHSK